MGSILEQRSMNVQDVLGIIVADDEDDTKDRWLEVGVAVGGRGLEGYG